MPSKIGRSKEQEDVDYVHMVVNELRDLADRLQGAAANLEIRDLEDEATYLDSLERPFVTDVALWDSLSTAEDLLRSSGSILQAVERQLKAAIRLSGAMSNGTDRSS